ncbi:MAG: DUF169 domain-containing protein [Desulfuromonadales bacterium]|nr:DUF169 domain-containing protein [Desulfuromonadales bacterium]
MHSRIAAAVGLKHQPVALLWSEEKPAEAMQFEPGKWGCVMWLAASAAKGRPGVCDRETFGCFGGGVGAGFGNQYANFPGGEECFCRFLSTGNADSADGRQAAEAMRPFVRPEFVEHFLHGERYLQSPEKVEQFIASLPMTEIPARYLLFQPLTAVDPAQQTPQTVVFFADPDQLSAMVVLANYGRGDNENVFIPWGAGCQTVGIYPYREALRERPRGVVGLTDLSARLYLRRQLGDGLLSFAAPWSLFQEMEENVDGSFLQGDTWQALLAAKGQGE